MKIGKGAIQRRHGLRRKVIGFVVLVSICIFWLIFLVPFFGSILFLTGIKNNLERISINKIDLTPRSTIDVNIGYLKDFPLFNMQVLDFKVGFSTSRNEHPIGYLYTERIEIPSESNPNIIFSMKYAEQKKRDEIAREFLLKIENHIVFTLQGTCHFKINKYLPGISVPVSFPYAIGIFIGSGPPKSEKLIDIFKDLTEKPQKTKKTFFPINLAHYTISEDDEVLTVSGKYMYRSIHTSLSIFVPAMKIIVLMNSKRIGKLSIEEYIIRKGSINNNLNFVSKHTIDEVIHLRKCLELYFDGSIVEVTFEIEAAEEFSSMPSLFHYEIIKEIASVYVHRLVRRKNEIEVMIKQNPLFELQIEDVTPTGLICNMFFNEEIFPYKNLVEIINTGDLPSADLQMLLNDEMAICASFFSKVPLTRSNSNLEYLTFNSTLFFPTSFTDTNKIIFRKCRNQPIMKTLEIRLDSCEGKILSILLESFGMRWKSGKGICIGYKWKEPLNVVPSTKIHNANYNIMLGLEKEVESVYKFDTKNNLSGVGVSELIKSPLHNSTLCETGCPISFLTGLIDLGKREQDPQENIMRITWPNINMVFMYDNQSFTLELEDSNIDILISPATSEWSMRSDKLVPMKMCTNKYFGVIREKELMLVSIFKNGNITSAYNPSAIRINADMYPKETQEKKTEDGEYDVLNKLMAGFLNNTQDLCIKTEEITENEINSQIITGVLNIDPRKNPNKKSKDSSAEKSQRSVSVNIKFPSTCVILKRTDRNSINIMFEMDPCSITIAKKPGKDGSVQVISDDNQDVGCNFRFYFTDFMSIDWNNMEIVGVNDCFFPYNRQIKSVYNLVAKKLKKKSSTADENNDIIKKTEEQSMKNWKNEIESRRLEKENKLNFQTKISEDAKGTILANFSFLFGGSHLIYKKNRKDSTDGILSSPGLYLKLNNGEKTIVALDGILDVVYREGESFTFETSIIASITCRFMHLLYNYAKDVPQSNSANNTINLALGYIDCSGKRINLFNKIEFDVKHIYEKVFTFLISTLKNKKFDSRDKTNVIEPTTSLKVTFGNIENIVVTGGRLLVDPEILNTSKPLFGSFKDKLLETSTVITSINNILRKKKPIYSTYIPPNFRDIRMFIKTHDRLLTTKNRINTYKEVSGINFVDKSNFVNYSIPITVRNGFLDKVRIEYILQKFKNWIGTTTQREISVELLIENMHIGTFYPNSDRKNNPVFLLINSLCYKDQVRFPRLNNAKNGVLKTNVSLLSPHIILVQESSLNLKNSELSLLFKTMVAIYAKIHKSLYLKNTSSWKDIAYSWASWMVLTDKISEEESANNPSKYRSAYVHENKVAEVDSKEKKEINTRNFLMDVTLAVNNSIRSLYSMLWIKDDEDKSKSQLIPLYLSVDKNDSRMSLMKNTSLLPEDINCGMLYFNINNVEINVEPDFNSKSSPYILVAYNDTPLMYISLDLKTVFCDNTSFLFPIITNNKFIYKWFLELINGTEDNESNIYPTINLYMYLICNEKVVLYILLDRKFFSLFRIIKENKKDTKSIAHYIESAVSKLVLSIALVYTSINQDLQKKKEQIIRNKINYNALDRSLHHMSSNLMFERGSHTPRIVLV